MLREETYDCPVCGGESTQCYRCDNVIGETADGEPVECGADLVGRDHNSTAGLEDT